MKLSGIIDALVASGASAKQLAAVVRAWEGEQSLDLPWRRLRAEVLARDGYACRYCGASVGDNFACDHVVPRSKGGRNRLENCVVSCKRCNSSKKDRCLKDWRRP